MSAQQRLEATIYGRVQGVSFRYYTRQKARQLNLTGWVANHPDGSVRLVAEGARSALEELAAFLQQGPAAAQVSQVETTWGQTTGEWADFGVRL